MGFNTFTIEKFYDYNVMETIPWNDVYCLIGWDNTIHYTLYTEAPKVIKKGEDCIAFHNQKYWDVQCIKREKKTY